MAHERFDVAVIGGGIAGTSVAAELSKDRRVLLLEMESQPGYHTTGRSAAVYAAVYGPSPIRALTRASRAFFASPSTGHFNTALFRPRPIMMIARQEQEFVLDQTIAEVGVMTPVERINESAMRKLNPLVKRGYASAAMLDMSGEDIDVAALHQGYLRQFRDFGGDLRCNATVLGLTHTDRDWQINTEAGEFSVDTIVNAAGAWAEHIGGLAQAESIGLMPKRRTAAIVAAPIELAPETLASLPITIDIEENFYLKPDAGRLLISPADETPSPACDAQPEDMDIALCVERIEEAFDLQVHRIESKWAGLRSFVADKCPVVGYSTTAPAFFWLAGQGGYGIQTAPALARLAASQVLQRPMPEDIAAEGVDLSEIDPSRLANRAE
ncbi:MAG: FAD-binding oxidoreductase [Pseudomonadales bacterium]|nr:FAD-binding oxidoreductase [Pseudomonadales bacterium]